MELLWSVWFQNILNKTQFSVFYFKKDPQRKNQNLNFNTSQLYKKKQRSGKRIKTQKRKLEAYWNLSCYWHTKDPTRQKRLLWCEGESFYWKLRAFSATKLFLKKLDKKMKKKNGTVRILMKWGSEIKMRRWNKRRVPEKWT